MSNGKAIEVKENEVFQELSPQAPAGLTFLSEQMNIALSRVPVLNVEEAINRVKIEMDSAPKEIDDYAYSRPVGGGQIEEGLSIQGALLLRDKVAELGFIIELDPNYRKEEDDEQITITAIARRVFPCAVAPNLKTGRMEQFNITITESPGYRRVNKEEMKHDQSGTYDVRFALEKAVSIAYRNAILNLLPDKLTEEIRQHAIVTGRVKKGDIPTRKMGGYTQKKNGADTRLVTEPQLTRLRAIMNNHGYTDAVIKSEIKKRWELDSTKALNRDQYEQLCQDIEADKIPKIFGEKLI